MHSSVAQRSILFFLLCLYCLSLNCCSVGLFVSICVYHFFFQSALHWSVAVSTICCHSSRVVVFLQAVAMPKFRGPRSASSVARSSCWSLPVGRYLSDTRCKGSVVVLVRWTASNMAEEPQTSISHQVRERWTTSGSSDFRIWHMVSIRYPQDLAQCPCVKCIEAREQVLCGGPRFIMWRLLNWFCYLKAWEKYVFWV